MVIVSPNLLCNSTLHPFWEIKILWRLHQPAIWQNNIVFCFAIFSRPTIVCLWQKKLKFDLLYLSFGQWLPMATGPLCCLCFAALSCATHALLYLVYGTCVLYIGSQYSAPTYSVFSTRPMIPHTVYEAYGVSVPSTQAYSCVLHSWPDHNFSIDSRPDTSLTCHNFQSITGLHTSLACHNFSLAPGLLSYVSQVPTHYWSHCRTLSYEEPTLPAHLPRSPCPSIFLRGASTAHLPRLDHGTLQ